MFKARLVFCKTVKGSDFLELYAGAKVVTKKVRQLGSGCIPFGIDDSPAYELELARRCVQKHILGWVRSGVVAGIFFGTQCSSWTRARRGPLGSAWRTIRSNAHIFGLPGLSDKDNVKICNGNLRVKKYVPNHLLVPHTPYTLYA